MPITGEQRNRIRAAFGDMNVGDKVANILDGLAVQARRLGNAAGQVVERIGKTDTEGLETVRIDETVTTTSATFAALTATIPVGAVIRSVQANLVTAAVGDDTGDNGMVKVGIGISGTPSKYGLTSVLTKNAKVDTIPAHAVISVAENLRVSAVATGGAAVTEKFVAGCKIRVTVVYDVLNSLDDAP